MKEKRRNGGHASNVDFTLLVEQEGKIISTLSFHVNKS